MVNRAVPAVLGVALMSSTALADPLTINNETIYGDVLGPTLNASGIWPNLDFSLIPHDNNQVNLINNSQVQGIVAGGVGDKTANHNSVGLTTGSFVPGYSSGYGAVHGGLVMSMSGDGSADHNSVDITQGMTNNAYGALVTSMFGEGTANYNSVAITQGSMTDNAFGGMVSSMYGGGTANNTVTITDSIANYSIVGGMVQSGHGNAVSNKNTVTVGNTTSYSDPMTLNVSGGMVMSTSGDGTADYNSVAITDGSKMNTASGGMVSSMYGSGTANHNSVAVDHATMMNVSGGMVMSTFGGGTSDNAITITDSTVSCHIGGGLVQSVDSATSNKNTVAISRTGAFSVSGGGVSTSGNAAANHNSVAIADASTVYFSVLGGQTSSLVAGDAVADNNAVSITGGSSVMGMVSGSQANATNGVAASSHNSVIINTSGAFSVSGGGASSMFGEATANHNSVAITNGGSCSVAGATVMSLLDGGAANNTVTITGSAITGYSADFGAVYGSMVMSTSGAGAANQNRVVIADNSTVVGLVYGGQTTSMMGGNAAADQNSVNLTGSAITGQIYGGHTQIYGDSMTANGRATSNYNRVAITDGTVSGKVYGGMARNTVGDATANNNTVIIDGTSASALAVSGGGSYATGTAAANNNALTILGGTVSGDIMGGTIHLDNYTATGTATGNTITIGGTANLAGADLYGGHLYSASLSESADLWTGNTLNVKNADMSVGAIYNFENLNFYLPATMAAGETMLSVSESSVNIANSKIGVGIDGRTSALNVGDTVTLIDTEAGLTAAGVNSTASGVVGISKIYDFGLTWDESNLNATLRQVTDNPQTKALSEGQLSSLSFLNQGADLVTGSGMGNMLLATAQSRSGAADFGAIGGGKSRYKTGSHVDVSGVSLMAGLARKAGAITAGAFLEVGEGSYDSYNSFNSAPSVKGTGDTSYVGIGTLGRYDMKNVYGEASARIGRVKTDFSSNDIMNGMGGTTEYETSALYAGAHVGAGYLHNLDRNTSVDLSARLFWTYQGGDDVSIAGDDVKFDAANSLRSRAGARLSYAITLTPSLYPLESGMYALKSLYELKERVYEVKPTIVPYAGAYLDYEFGGKGKAEINGEPIDTPELKGLSGVGELGLAMNPLPAWPLTIDAGAQGYVGTREGISGSLALKYEF
jgi:hypothetical protein